MKRESNQNLSGNEVYYTNSLILLVKHMLCSILDYSKGFDFISFSYKSLTAVGARRARARALRLAARSVPPRDLLVLARATVRVARPAHLRYRGTSLIRNSTPLGHYSRTIRRALWWPWGGGGLRSGSRVRGLFGGSGV